MTDHPNYREINPPSDKPRSEYTYSERRAALYDAIENAGYHRNLEKSTRQLGDEFGVSHTTIRNDIQAVLEWWGGNLGENAEAELEILKSKAVQEHLDRGEPAKAYDLARKHFQTLMEAGVKDKAPDKTEITGSGGGPLEINISHHRVSEDDNDG